MYLRMFSQFKYRLKIFVYIYENICTSVCYNMYADIGTFREYVCMCIHADIENMTVYGDCLSGS